MTSNTCDGVPNGHRWALKLRAYSPKLMGSPGHRANILEPRFARAGVAVVRAGKVWFYVTVFAD